MRLYRVERPVSSRLLGDRLVHAPGRGHGERLEVDRGPGSAAPSRRGSSARAAAARPRSRRPRRRRRLVHRGHRHATGLLGVGRVAHVGVGLAGVGVGRVGLAGGELHRRDPADQVHRVGDAVDDLLGAVERAEQLAFEDVGQVLAGGPGAAVGVMGELVGRPFRDRGWRGERLGAWSFVIPLVFFVGRGRCLALGGGAAVVLLEQPVEDLDPRGGTDRPPRHLPVGVEAVVELHVAPAVGVHDRVVELDVDLAAAARRPGPPSRRCRGR